MRTFIVNFALLVEALLLVWTGYVFYRWSVATGGTDEANMFADLIPYNANFEVVVAPWLAAASVIPLWFGLSVFARTMRKR